MHDPIHLTRLTELESISRQIKNLESMMGEARVFKVDEETGSQRLDAEEETVTREFLRMLESEGQEYEFNPGPVILQRQKTAKMALQKLKSSSCFQILQKAWAVWFK